MSPAFRSGSDQNGLPAVTRCPATAKLPCWPGSWVPGTCPGLTFSWASAVPSMMVNRHRAPKAGMRKNANGCPVASVIGSGTAGIAGRAALVGLAGAGAAHDWLSCAANCCWAWAARVPVPQVR